MKQVFGGILAAVGGGLIAYGIVDTIDTATAGAVTVTEFSIGPAIGAIIGGMLAYMVGVFMWRGGFVVGPVVGLVVAFGLLLADGAELSSTNLGFAGFIAFCVLLGPAILVVIFVLSRRKQRKAQHLVATGQKAVAHIQGVRETGVFINHRPQVEVQYMIHPLSGQQAFPHTKKQTLSYAAIPPRPGLAWPAWFDPANPGDVAIGAPSGQALDPASEAQFAEFGLTPAQVFGYDPRAGGLGAAAAQPSFPPRSSF